MMALDGYVEYESRSYCKDVACPVQACLDEQEKGSKKYEAIRGECKQCNAWRFHNWLNEREYIIVKPKV